MTRKTMWAYKLEGRHWDEEVFEFARKFGITDFHSAQIDYALPEPFVEEPSAHSFQHHATIYMPQFIELRKVKFPRADGRPGFDWLHAHIFWFSDRAWAVVYPEHTYDVRKPLGLTRYFRLGCNHKFTGKTIGRCLTEYTCELCGSTHTIDSSD